MQLSSDALVRESTPLRCGGARIRGARNRCRAAALSVRSSRAPSLDRARGDSVEAETLAAPFAIAGARLEVRPGGEASLDLRFLPQSPGEYTADLFLNTNDPDARRVHVTLVGSAFGADLEEGEDDPRTLLSEGCGCSSGSVPCGGGASVWWLGAIALASMRWGRR